MAGVLDGEGAADVPGEDAEQSEHDDASAEGLDDGALVAAGITREELAACASVLRRLDAAKARVDWQARALRELRKALALHCRDAFGQLPQKDELDVRERQRLEKQRKRERRQRQLEADRRWKENAQLRASRLEKLQALEAGAAPDGGTLALEGPVDAASAQLGGSSDAGGTGQQPLGPCLKRIPDGPALDGLEGIGQALRGEESAGEEEPPEYSRQQACYTCKARFSERHHFYSHLCPQCAALNFEKRHQRVDLHGYVCLVTGARVKIGFQTALKLLRMGARVIATTRFPSDARRRYGAEPDAGEWSARLDVRGADFRFLGTVEAFCERLCSEEQWLDVLVNNACQTVRRPAAYYRHLLAGEAAIGGARSAALAAPAEPPEPLAPSADGAGAAAAGTLTPVAVGACAAVSAGLDGSAAMSQLAVLAEDRLAAEEAALALPAGECDAHGQQLDLRSTNSWLLRLGEVATPEAVEVFCINALAPFVLNGRLRPLLEKSPHPTRYIVNVSAMEGKFYRYKQATHPHTNMAKAALNMMTRTSAEDFARTSRIFMNSVDTGWINDENPLPTAQRIAADHGFQTPIDEVDAAARILDPIVTGVRVAAEAAQCPSTSGGQRPRKGGGGGGGGGAACTGLGLSEARGEDLEPPWGRFFKDYAPTEW